MHGAWPNISRIVVAAGFLWSSSCISGPLNDGNRQRLFDQQDLRSTESSTKEKSQKAGMPESSTRRTGAESGATDVALVARAQKGDRSAFAELYLRHAPALARLAAARTGAGEIDDAVAETFARAWKSIGKFTDTGRPFVSWLYAIGRNVIADGHRRAARMKVEGDIESMSIGVSDRKVERLADLIDLGRALGSLNKRQRAVIELKYLAGLNNDEVGDALGIAPGAVNTLQWRALKKLESVMGPRTGGVEL